ncbi:siderophore ABC transporter substrate-binding protein [Tateyamaria omphalii]|uniref:siderophore ABC transporter substrate-binding protein n=1 Tax=Tateyamaria omphalii TaxID=299262 RepID=UPI001C99788C|nr:siderophore ABC transporter substrate-binding protein [Tateyamaria omphalii]MBY5934963.1 siderophore ABC transporter substrate-binding protein [Tateyamaria omphalii]
MLRFTATIAALFAFGTAAHSQTTTIETYSGQVEVTPLPQTIAVMDFAILDTLEALDVSADGVVGPPMLDYLTDAMDGAAPMGTLFEPDYEAIAALAPDLILAGGRSSKVVPDLARVAPTVDMTIWEDVVGQGLDRLAAYGTIFGKEDQAAALAATFNARLDTLAAALEGNGNALIVMTNGPKVSAYGAESRFGWLHTDLGLPPTVETVEESTHGEAISFEFIRDANPDILLVIDRMSAIGEDGASARAALNNPLVHETNAWKNDRVVYLSSAPIYLAGGGIQSMMLTLDEIAAALTDL